MDASIVVVSVVSSYPHITAHIIVNRHCTVRSIRLLWTKIKTSGQKMVSCRVFTAILVLELRVVKAGNPENSELVRSNGRHSVPQRSYVPIFAFFTPQELRTNKFVEPFSRNFLNFYLQKRNSCSTTGTK